MAQNDDFKDGGSQDVNPFSADLGSNFEGVSKGGGSQIFKDGGFAEENKGKLIALAIALVAILGGGIYFWSSGPSEPATIVTAPETEHKAKDSAHKENGDDDWYGEDDDDMQAPAVKKEEVAKAQESKPLQAGEQKDKDDEDIVEENHAGLVKSKEHAVNPGNEATVAPTLEAPGQNYTHVYDETKKAPELTWKGSPGGHVLLSRNSSMKQATKIDVMGNSLRFAQSYPGTWYWQVVNGAGMSEVGSFVILPPIRRNVVLTAPLEGGSLSANGGVVSWTGDHNVSYYRVEISSVGFVTPSFSFATSGTQISIAGIPSGSYSLRLGAFSDVAGRWEYSNPITVSVQ